MTRFLCTSLFVFTLSAASFAQSSADSLTVFCLVLEQKGWASTEIDMGDSNIIAGLDTSYLLAENKRPRKFNTTVEALNLLSINGWELVGFCGRGGEDGRISYLFKMRVAKK